MRTFNFNYLFDMLEFVSDGHDDHDDHDKHDDHLLPGIAEQFHVSLACLLYNSVALFPPVRILTKFSRHPPSAAKNSRAGVSLVMLSSVILI